MKKRILLVGCTSKISREIIAVMAADYDLYGMCRQPGRAPEGLVECIALDLTDDSAIVRAAHQLRGFTFDAVLYLSSTYDKDETDAALFAAQQKRDMQINVLAARKLIAELRLSEDSTVLLFGDSYPHMPRPGQISYSRSKMALEQETKVMAKTYAPDTKVICLRLGPVLAEPDHADKPGYYSRNIVRCESPVAGLVAMIGFLVSTPGLCMTGSLIDYDGGAYLDR